MQKGWNAKGLLTPLYKKHGGRDGLAAKTGVPAGTLSRINTGAGNMGEDVAQRLVGPLKISVLELGAPAEMVDDKGRPALERLEELAAMLGDVLEHQLKTDDTVRRLDERLRTLEEVRHGEDGAAARDPA